MKSNLEYGRSWRIRDLAYRQDRIGEDMAARETAGGGHKQGVDRSESGKEIAHR